MSRPLRIHPRADLDVTETFAFLAVRNARAARRFLDGIEAALTEIESRPENGLRYVRAERPDEDWRYVRVAGFKMHFFFYRIGASETEVVRMVHGARDLNAIFRVL